MTAPHTPTPWRRWRWYRRFMDWLWHGPLTRDLHPPPTPSQLSQALALLADLARSARAPARWRGGASSNHPSIT